MNGIHLILKNIDLSHACHYHIMTAAMGKDNVSCRLSRRVRNGFQDISKFPRVERAKKWRRERLLASYLGKRLVFFSFCKTPIQFKRVFSTVFCKR